MRFPRENRTYFLECAANTGMEWRGAQLNGCQFTHGMIHNVVYTGVPLRTSAGRSGRADECRLDPAGRRGCLGHDPVDPAGKGAG
jgi:hypothetical protein